MKYFLLFILLIPFSIKAEDKSVYGEDNRRDLTEVRNPLYQSWAKSVAAMISTNYLFEEANHYRIKAKMLSQHGICEYERFSRQITAADCSGFLIDKDLIVTAGHCMTKVSDCQNWKWVFDYKASSQYKIGRRLKVRKQNVYKCKEVVTSILKNGKLTNDYAIIRLDRPVLDRSPLKVRETGKIERNTPLVIMGFPSGLPLKVADNATAIDINPKTYFVANTDSFGGNSGAPVFNEETGLVEGILVRGGEDYHYEKRGKKRCLVPTICDSQDHCEGESITRITEIIPHLPFTSKQGFRTQRN